MIGIYIAIISTFSMCLLIFSNKFFIKIYRNYWFLFCISIIYLVYISIFRVSRNWIDYFEMVKNLDYNKIFEPYYYSYLTSKIFMLDLCPIVSIILPISIIVDKSRNTSKVISLFSFFGGFFTIFFGMTQIKEISIPFWKFIFIGDNNYTMFMYHYIMMLLSLIILINSKKFTKWSFVGSVLFITIFIIYVLIVSSIFSIETNTTGLKEGDWYSPYDKSVYWYCEYGKLAELTKLSYIGNVIFWYSIWTICIILEIIIKNVATKSNELSTYKLWWKKLWRIDLYLNNLSNIMFSNDKIIYI